MGILSGAASKAMDNQSNAIQEEAKAAGCTIQDIETIESEENTSASNVMGSAIKSVFGGSLQPTAHQFYLCSSSFGEHLYVQPYATASVLPGEHHAFIEGSYNATFYVQESFWTKKDNLALYFLLIMCTFGLILLLKLHKAKIVSDDKAFAKKLSKNETLLKAFKGLKYEWGIGTTKIEHKWSIQVRSLGNGFSHVILQSGRYGGITTYKVGMKKFVQVCKTLTDAMPKKHAPQNYFLMRPTYSEIAEHKLLS